MRDDFQIGFYGLFVADLQDYEYGYFSDSGHFLEYGHFSDVGVFSDNGAFSDIGAFHELGGFSVVIGFFVSVLSAGCALSACQRGGSCPLRRASTLGRRRLRGCCAGTLAEPSRSDGSSGGCDQEVEIRLLE